MKKLSLLLIYALLAIAFSQAHSTQELSLTMKVRNPEILFKEPTSMEIILKNEGKIPLKLPFEPDGDVLGPWSSKPSVLICTEDKKDVFCIQDSRTMKASFDSILYDGGYITPPGGTFTFEVKMILPKQYVDKAGKMEIYCRYVSKGKHLGQLGAAVGKNGEIVEPAKYYCEGCWEGSVESVPFPLNIAMPSGVDLKAYDYFKGGPLSKPAELLQKFPTSTYAAYAACPPNQSTSNTDPERVLKLIETGTYLSNGSVPDDTGKSKDGWLYLGGNDLIEWRAKWIGIVLKNHPDIWYADHLRLRLAVDQVALKNYQAGESDLEKLSKEAMPEVAEKAKAYLSLMKQKGWVRAGNEKVLPQAKAEQ